MAEPTYEVKLKEGDNSPEPTSSLSEEKISSLVETKAQEKAEAIASSKVEQLKEELAQSLSGRTQSRYGKTGPESWEKFQDDTTERAVKIAEEKIEKRLAAERKAQEEREASAKKQQEELAKAEHAKISQEWIEAVEDGVLPAISPEVEEKLRNGATLTKEDKEDKGLKAYNEARLLYVKLKNEGRANSFYRTALKYYGKQPAGATAPVFGGGAATPGPSSEDYTYEDIQRNRKSRFGY